ncbi:35812_t:CDS:2, partial [Racocetra persica]
MIETVDDIDELIKYSFNILWKATEGKIAIAIFNDPLFQVTFILNDGTPKVLNLDVPKEPNDSYIQESLQNSSFDVPISNQISNDSDDFPGHNDKKKDFSVVSENTKSNERQGLETNIQELIQNTDYETREDAKMYQPQINKKIKSDEYSNSAEEIDKQEFDNTIISMLRKNNSSQSKINKKSKASEENTNK